MEDTPQNRVIWAHEVSVGHLLPGRSSWLKVTAAKRRAAEALQISERSLTRFDFSCRRYELGWHVDIRPKGDKWSIGSESTVVVGDDGMVKHIYKGL